MDWVAFVISIVAILVSVFTLCIVKIIENGINEFDDVDDNKDE